MDQTEKPEKKRAKELDDNSESLNTMEQYVKFRGKCFALQNPSPRQIILEDKRKTWKNADNPSGPLRS